MIRAYQVGIPDAFGNHGEPMRLRSLDSNYIYVDGISAAIEGTCIIVRWLSYDFNVDHTQPLLK